jgi:hypothetical protein
MGVSDFPDLPTDNLVEEYRIAMARHSLKKKQQTILPLHPTY